MSYLLKKIHLILLFSRKPVELEGILTPRLEKGKIKLVINDFLQIRNLK